MASGRVDPEVPQLQKPGSSNSIHGIKQSKAHTLSQLKVDRRQRSASSAAEWTSQESNSTLNPETRGIVTSRVQELSQLESPQLRQLADRLGALFKVETPKAKWKSEHPYAGEQTVRDRWEILQGCNRWRGLLNPIDRALKAEILRYGDFAQATYDCFDDGSVYRHYRGTCKYKKGELLKKVGLENRGYEITKFLYATTNLPNFLTGDSEQPMKKPSNWMGFVAVCTSPEEIHRLGRRDILVAWRGTGTSLEWISNFKDIMSPLEFGPHHASKAYSKVRVESGFKSVYTSKNDKSHYNKTSSARDQVQDAVKALVEKYKHEDRKLSITITGHSLGSALAILCAFDLASSGTNLLCNAPSVPLQWNSAESYTGGATVHQDGAHPGFSNDKKGNKFPSGKVPITVYSFAGPRVGNRALGESLEKLDVPVLRVVNKQDIVVELPGLNHFGLAALQETLHRGWSGLPSYKHVGVELLVDNQLSDYLKKYASGPNDSFKLNGIRWPHSLETYLHLVDAFQGSGIHYSKTFRDYALVNKHSDFLRSPYRDVIPPFWWQEENKGLVRDDDGVWRFPNRDDDDMPMSPKPEEEFHEFWRNLDAAKENSKAAMHQNGSLRRPEETDQNRDNEDVQKQEQNFNEYWKNVDIVMDNAKTAMHQNRPFR